jgi:hypothetical protein
MDPTNDAINEVTAPLRTGVKIMQLAKEGAKLAKEGAKWVGGYKLIEAGSNWNTNNVTREATIGNVCRQVGLDLNQNKITVKQAVINLKAYAVSDNLVNETIEAANRFHPEGLRYGKDCYYVTARPNPFQKQFWQKPLHVRKGWKRKTISGKEEWVKDSDSTTGDPTRRSEEQNLRGFEEQLVEPPPKQPRRPLRRPVKQSRAGGAGSSAGRGGLRGGGGAENDHSTQSQVEVMTKKSF